MVPMSSDAGSMMNRVQDDMSDNQSTGTFMGQGPMSETGSVMVKVQEDNDGSSDSEEIVRGEPMTND